jgi:hypothetical protein
MDYIVTTSYPQKSGHKTGEMPKIMQSLLKALGDQPSEAKLDNIDMNNGTSSSGGGSRREKPSKQHKSVLDADSRSKITRAWMAEVKKRVSLPTGSCQCMHGSFY